MKTYDATAHIYRKPDVLNPEEPVIAAALKKYGFPGVSKIRKGVFVTVTLESEGAEEAAELLKSMCKKLLANTVTDVYRVLSVVEKPLAAAAVAAG